MILRASLKLAPPQQFRCMGVPNIGRATLTWIKVFGLTRNQHKSSIQTCRLESGSALARPNPEEEAAMRKYRTRLMLAALMGILSSAGLATPSVAETGQVSVVFTK